MKAGARVSILTGIVCGMCLALAACASTPVSHDSPASVNAIRSCPPKAQTTLPASSLAGASSHLVPISPTGVTVCHYRPTVAPSLQSHLIIENSARASRIATFLNHAGNHYAGAVNCPADSGESVEFFFWNNTSRSEVILGITGCVAESNGSTYRLDVVLTPSFLKLAGLPSRRDAFTTTR